MYLLFVYSIVIVLSRPFLKTFPYLMVWPPIIYWKFLLHFNTITDVAWKAPWNSVFVWDMPVSIQSLRYVTECSVECYWHWNSVVVVVFWWIVLFLSILLTFLICLSRTSHLYCGTRNFQLLIARFLSNSVVVERIVISLKSSLYVMLLFRDLGYFDLACKNGCWSVSFQYKVILVLLFSSLYNIVSRNATFLEEIWKSNLIVLCFSFSCFMNFIIPAFVPSHIIKMWSIYLRYSKHHFNVWIDVFCFKICQKDVRIGWSTYSTHGIAVVCAIKYKVIQL